MFSRPLWYDRYHVTATTIPPDPFLGLKKAVEGVTDQQRLLLRAYAILDAFDLLIMMGHDEAAADLMLFLTEELNSIEDLTEPLKAIRSRIFAACPSATVVPHGLV